MSETAGEIVTYGMPVCLFCRHLRHDSTVRPQCDAFPTGIPASIWPLGGLHIEPVQGDHGIRFEQDDSGDLVQDMLARREDGETQVAQYMAHLASAELKRTQAALEVTRAEVNTLRSQPQAIDVHVHMPEQAPPVVNVTNIMPEESAKVLVKDENGKVIGSKPVRVRH